MRRAPLVLLCCAALLPAVAAARTSGQNDQAERLLRVVSPAGTARVPAHPFVNIVVHLGTTDATADPSTFKAHLGGVNVTPLFEPMLEKGALTGLRAAIGPALLNVGHGTNRLRLDVGGHIGKRRVHDIDRVRFTAVDVPDAAPIAKVVASSDVLLAGVPEQFDGSQSHDPDDDPITYLWEFGDGTTSTEVSPVHTFGPSAQDVSVRLTVSDGQLDSSDQVTMLSVPTLCAGCTPGVLKIQAAGQFEFGPVALGSTASKTFTVTNAATAATSSLHVRLGTTNDAFALGMTDVTLGPSESASVDVTFAPTVGGHQSSDLTLVASASNQTSVHMFTHGYGGTGIGKGPLPTSDPVFYEDSNGTGAIYPNGLQLTVDDSIRTCVTPQNGPGYGDYCITNADCASNNGTCPGNGTCFGGDRAGQPCTTAGQCPNSFGCSSATPYGPVKMCGDGAGGLFELSDEGTYTDPNPNDDTELDGTLMHIMFDGSGNRLGAEIVERTTENTSQIACDAIPTGNVYMAKYFAVNSPSNCFRSDREALVAIKKTNGNETTLLSRIDAAEGLGPCDDYDPSDDLEATRDSSAVFVALPGGIIRIRPTTLLMTPDVDDVFAVHPDGSVLAVVRGNDKGPTGTLLLYKISPDQAVNGAPHLTDLTPCATITVPSNRGNQVGALTTFVSFAVDPASKGSFDGTVLLSFFTGGGGIPGPGLAAPLPSTLHVQGTYAISSPAGSNECQVIGLVNLLPLDQLAF
jgi:PKD repeat protein